MSFNMNEMICLSSKYNAPRLDLYGKHLKYDNIHLQVTTNESLHAVGPQDFDVP
jgi:hypothetical protein